MASTRDIRRRIKSVKNTSQITKAMQMVAASKMRRAQQAALAGRPYALQINKMLASLRKAQNLEEINHPFLAERENKTPGVLLITTDKGLCGALNSNLLREILKQPETAKFAVVGKKGKQFLVRTRKNLVADFELRDAASALEVKQVSQFLIDQFLAGEIDSINIAFPRFINTLVQKPSVIQVLPIQKIAPVTAGTGQDAEQPQEEEEIVREYLFEPKASELLDKLLPYYVHFLVYQMFLNARASEHSARMVAMKSATDNANQLIKDLTLQYNKARQASITNELLEITTAQMALN